MAVKFNLMPVKLLTSPKTKGGVYFSHIYCDVCEKQGIKFEGIAYTGPFESDLIKFNTCYSDWKKLDIQEKDISLRRYSLTGKNRAFKSLMYYLCSEECANMLILQLGDADDVVSRM